jgi:predicted transcriptional regulator
MSNNALLLSIRVRFSKLIFAGAKTVELRRLHPRINPGDLVFMYVPSPVKAVEGAFEVKKVLSRSTESIWRQFGSKTGLSKREFDTYYQGKETACAIVIGRVWRFGKPVHLETLKESRKGFRPPQSHHYICEVDFSRSVGFRKSKKLAA